MKRSRARAGIWAIAALVSAGPATAESSLNTARSAQIDTGTLEDPVYVRELAEGRYLEGDLEGAVRFYLEVARLSVAPAERSAALLNAGWLQFLLGREGPALTALHTALRYDPDLEFDARLFSPEFETLYLRARVLSVRESASRSSAATGPEPTRPARPETIYRQGVEKLDRGDVEGALALLQRAAALTYGPDDDRLDLRRTALLRLGLIYYERGQWGDAANAFEQAVGLQRSDASAWRSLGLARLKQGDLPAAIDAFREAYARLPGSPDNARSLARTLVEARRWDDAVSWIGDAIRHHDRDAYLRLQLGEAQAGRGSRQRAGEAWRAAMELDGSLDWAHGRRAALLLALASFESGDFADSAAVARAALERDPRDAAFWNLLGLSQQATGRMLEARESFLAACDHDDGRAEYRNNLGRAYAAVGDLPRAEQEFVHALTLEPELPAAQANLAQVRKLLQEQ